MPVSAGNTYRHLITTLTVGGLNVMPYLDIPSDSLKGQQIPLIICTSCGALLPATDSYFQPHKGREYGIEKQCKKCVKEYKRQYALKNKEKISKRMKKYREENKENIRDNQIKYYAENRDKILKSFDGFGRKKYCA